MSLKLKSVLIWLTLGYVGYLVWKQPGFSGADIGTFISKTWGLLGDIFGKLGDFIGSLTKESKASTGPVVNTASTISQVVPVATTTTLHP